MKKTIIYVLIGCASIAHAAADYDLDACMFSNGRPMHPKTCESLRKRAEQEVVEQARRKERQELYQQELKVLQEKRQAEEQEKQRQREQQQAEWQARRDAEKALALKAQEDQRAWEVASEKAAANRTAERKTACGDDYKNLQIGMTVNQMQQCVAPFKLVGQLNRADGVVSTYRSGSVYAHVMSGRVVSWSK